MRVAALASIALALCVPGAMGLDGWQKMQDPPDVDKDYPNLTCWLATAANMLSGAGYGTGDPGDAQARAAAIYDVLVAHFGVDT